MSEFLDDARSSGPTGSRGAFKTVTSFMWHVGNPLREPRVECQPAQCQIFSDLLHILKDSTKTQIMRTFFPFCPQEYEGAPFSVMLGQQKCSEWRDKEWYHLRIEAAGPPRAVPKGHHPGSTWSESLLDARACCFLLGWTIKNSHTSSPILCESLFAMWLCCSYHQGWSLIFPSSGSRFGHMTCFDHWALANVMQAEAWEVFALQSSPSCSQELFHVTWTSLH